MKVDAETTFSPLLEEREYSSGLFARTPELGAGEFLVLIGPNGLLGIDKKNHGSISQKKLRQGKYYKIMRIDAKSHHICLVFSPYSYDQLYRFRIVACADAVVQDAIQVYQAQVRDVSALLRDVIGSKIMERASLYAMGDYKLLQDDLDGLSSQLCSEHSSILEQGIAFTSLTLTVEIDEEYREHVRKKAKIRESGEVETVRMEVAKQMATQEVDAVAAAYSRVLSGEVTLEEALANLRGLEAAQFDENVRRVREVKKMLYDLVEDGILTEAQANQKVQEQISSFGILPKTGTKSGAIGGKKAKLLSRASASSFRPLDEEEEKQ